MLSIVWLNSFLAPVAESIGLPSRTHHAARVEVPRNVPRGGRRGPFRQLQRVQATCVPDAVPDILYIYIYIYFQDRVFCVDN